MNELTTYKPAGLSHDSGAPTEIASTRAAQEVQASMIIAKKFPRDEVRAWDRIQRACKRPGLAEVSAYTYPRGGTQVTGPSIRLAECLAQNWGNLDFGVVELEQREGESSVMAYAWDLETNCRQTKVFTVPHERKAGKEIKRLDDPRDIYEMVANQGARRLRACILGIIPGDIVESALSECEKTLKTGSKEPLIDRARKMVSAFGEQGVTQGMIEAKLGHKIDAISEQEMVNLRKVYTSIKDGAGTRDDFFKIAPVAESQPQPESKDDGDLGPQAEVHKPTPVPENATAQDSLKRLVLDNGFSFSVFVQFCEKEQDEKDATSWPDFDAVPTKLATRLLKAKPGLLAGLRQLQNPEPPIP